MEDSQKVAAVGSGSGGSEQGGFSTVFGMALLVRESVNLNSSL